MIALGGSCCSSCCSTRNSRDRCAVRAWESLPVTAWDVLIPRAVLWLIPVLIHSASVRPAGSLVSPLRDRVPGSSGRKLLRDDPCARLRPEGWLTQLDPDRDPPRLRVLG